MFYKDALHFTYSSVFFVKVSIPNLHGGIAQGRIILLGQHASSPPGASAQFGLPQKVCPSLVHFPAPAQQTLGSSFHGSPPTS